MKTLAADRAVSAWRALNPAIVNADIPRGYEEYLALVDQYYADDVEVSSDTSPEPVVGKDRLKLILFRFLGPLHMIAELGGLWVSIHAASIPGDSIDEQHSEWTLELIGVIRGAARGKVREKFTRVEDMLAALCMTTSSIATSTQRQATTDKTGRVVQEAYSPVSYAASVRRTG